VCFFSVFRRQFALFLFDFEGDCVFVFFVEADAHERSQEWHVAVIGNNYFLKKKNEKKKKNCRSTPSYFVFIFYFGGIRAVLFFESNFHR